MTTARLMGKQPTKATWLQLAAAQAAKSFLKSLQVLAIFHHYLHTPTTQQHALLIGGFASSQ